MLIRVPVHAVWIPIARFRFTVLFVPANLDILVIRLRDASQFLVSLPITALIWGRCKNPISNVHYITEPEPTFVQPTNPCIPSPCGPYAECRDIGGSPSCSCNANYIGSPPNCRPECIINPDCSSSKACMREKCRDPCPGSCGVNAQCDVINHTPTCTCPEGYTGDPFTNCYPKPPPRKKILLILRYYPYTLKNMW